MLLQIGQRTRNEDLVDALLECHERIRKFLAFASRLATTRDVPDANVKELASQIHRYFTVSFPLHLADEDESITRALENATDAQDALSRMRADHVDHAHLVARLVTLVATIEAAPESVAHTRDDLQDAATALTAVLEPHLALEEEVIFPALRRLPLAVRDEIRAQMRSRRERASPSRR